MAFNPYSTTVLQKAVEQLPPITTFLKDRYFPDGQVFATNSFMIEYRNGKRKAAPFVTKRSEGIELEREGSTLKEFTPALIAPKRTLTLDQLEHRGFGEQINSQLTPQQRELYYNTKDLQELQPTIAITKEAMAAQVIFENKLTLTEYTDRLENGSERTIEFYDGTNNAVYTPSANWDYTEESGKQIIADIKAMIHQQTQNGMPASELICSEEAADIILGNVYIQKLLDNRRIEIGGISPAELGNGATEFAILNIGGRMIHFISYDQTYTAIDGTTKNFVPAGYVALAAPANSGVAGTNVVGQTVYGAITQMEDDKQFHTYSGIEVPQYVADVAHNEKSLILKSAPLVMPIGQNPFIVAKVAG